MTAADADRVREVLAFYADEDRWYEYERDRSLAEVDRNTGSDFDEHGQKARDLLEAMNPTNVKGGSDSVE